MVGFASCQPADALVFLLFSCTVPSYYHKRCLLWSFYLFTFCWCKYTMLCYIWDIREINENNHFVWYSWECLLVSYQQGIQNALSYIMASLRSRCGHYVFALWFLLSSFFSSPNLSRRRLDVYHTSTHGVALVRIYNACLKRAAHGSLKIQHAKNRQKFAIWAPLYNFVGLCVSN